MISSILGYNFQNPKLLEEALTHPSNCNKNNQQSYERFEFLGDTVLSLIITEMLMKQFPDEDEGKLAKRRAGLVAGEILAKIAQQNNLGNYIIMTEAEAKSGGRMNLNNLENVLEAIIGAMYLDSDLDSVKPILHNIWQAFIDDMPEVPIDPKSHLQEILQQSGFSLPKYELVGTVGPSHSLTFKVKLAIAGFEEIIGEGKSKQQAEKAAASTFLAKMHDKSKLLQESSEDHR